jgi:hypothetical protein
MSIRSGHRGAVTLAALALIAGLPSSALAALGDDAASVQVDQMRSAGSRRQVAGFAMQVHTITAADGSTIREYVSPAGRVFALSWNTHYKPRLDQLLGAQFATYAQAGRRAMRARPGVVHAAVLRSGDLVVESSAHLNAFVGRAYLRSLLPAGTSIDAIR